MKGTQIMAAIALMGIALAPRTARSTICALDNTPAATLLLPYFEVDLANPSGATTLFSINNANSGAVVVNVVLWTDLAVPTLNFPVYLTGYDVQTINLRDVFNGILPYTASDGQDPADTISPHGIFSQDINYSTCAGTLPLPPLPQTYRDHLRGAHTGGFSAILGGCAATRTLDNIARGYVTVDTASACTLLNPVAPGYFTTTTTQNVLWGDFFLVDPTNDYAQGENLVRIEADSSAFQAGKPTFYSRYVAGSALDAREPLPTVWASRFMSGGGFTAGTNLIVWRETPSPGQVFSCSNPQGPGLPLPNGTLVVFDEQERAEQPAPCVVTCNPFTPTFFPAATNRIRIGATGLPTSSSFGWLMVDFKDQPTAKAQAWMGTVMSASGKFSVGLAAQALDSGCQPKCLTNTGQGLALHPCNGGGQ